MSTLEIAIAYVIVLTAVVLFGISLCVAAKDGDKQMDEARRREAEDEQRARDDIYGPPWRSR